MYADCKAFGCYYMQHLIPSMALLYTGWSSGMCCKSCCVSRAGHLVVLGLGKELLTLFHPMVAGVTIPGIGLFFLMFIPYIDRNPSPKPEDRKFAISLMTVHLMFWAVLVMIGSFFRGPGFNFVFPWEAGLFFEL